MVGHGITNRVLTYARYNKSNDWYEQEPNPDNCAIRLMADEDCGYIFPNASGQWDETWKPEEPDAGKPRLNPEDKFFSPQQMKRLMDLQTSFPDIVKDVVEMLDNHGSLLGFDGAVAMATKVLPS